MSTSTSFRTTPEVEHALDELVSATHQDRSATIRAAILAAYRAQQADRVRAEAEQLARDPDDLAEMRAVRADLDAISAW